MNLTLLIPNLVLLLAAFIAYGRLIAVPAWHRLGRMLPHS